MKEQKIMGISEKGKDPSELKLEILEELLERSYQEILDLARMIKGETGIEIDENDIDRIELEERITNSEKIVKVLELGSIIDRRIMLLSLFLVPILKRKNEDENKKIDEEEKEIKEKLQDALTQIKSSESDSESDGGEEKEGEKELIQVIEEQIKNSDIDIKGITKLAELIGKYGEKAGGSKGQAAKIVSSVLNNETVQKIISDRFRGLLEKAGKKEKPDEIIASNVV